MGKKNIVKVKGIPDPVGPYSRAVEANGFIFVTGQLSQDLTTGNRVEGDIKVQTRQALKNLKTVLEAAGSTLDNVLKVLVFITDMNNWSAMNEAYKEVFTKDRPARSTIEVGLPEGYLVEIEAVAVH